MLNATEVGIITKQGAESFLDAANVTTASPGSSDVISDDGMTVDAWLKNFQLIITPILLVLGKYTFQHILGANCL